MKHYTSLRTHRESLQTTLRPKTPCYRHTAEHGVLLIEIHPCMVLLFWGTFQINEVEIREIILHVTDVNYGPMCV